MLLPFSYYSPTTSSRIFCSFYVNGLIGNVTKGTPMSIIWLFLFLLVHIILEFRVKNRCELNKMAKNCRPIFPGP